MAAPRDDWRRYVAPAAFLLAVTIAVVLVRSGLEHTTTTTTSTTLQTTTRTTTARVWTVRAGDTFALISRETGVTVARLRKLNPKANATSLFIGEKIRLR